MLQRYGLVPNMVRCPSSRVMIDREAAYFAAGYSWHKTYPTMIQNYNAAADTGTFIAIDEYPMLSNLTKLPAKNNADRHPAGYRLNDDHPSDRVLSADMVAYHGWINTWFVNHPGSDGLPDYQNIAYADGSVRPLTSGDYDRIAFADNHLAQVSFGDYTNITGWHVFWEGAKVR
jgi:hypothetical protein